MDKKLLIELFSTLIIGIRIFILYKFNIKSIADKIFALYYIKNHYPLLGYIVIFYIFELFFLELGILKIFDIAIFIMALIDLYGIYKFLFIALKTDDKDDFLDTIIKRMFFTLTYSEYQEIKNELTKPQPLWKLYLSEMSVFLFIVWNIEFM
jgi:hypothetical protein